MLRLSAFSATTLLLFQLANWALAEQASRGSDEMRRICHIRVTQTLHFNGITLVQPGLLARSLAQERAESGPQLT